jgi:hypothetical protein
MKILTAVKIREQVKAIWPGIKFQWMTDEKFSIVPLQDIKNFLAQSDLDKAEFIDHKQDCDDFALQLHAEAKRYFVKNADLEKPLAFGEVFCTKFDRVTTPHNANMAICEEGIYLIEPQTDVIRKGHPKNDQVLIVRM